MKPGFHLTAIHFAKPASQPQNVKRGGVGLYVKDSFPSKNRPDLVTLPEFVVCEIK